jgi:hypothetical protein
VEFNGGVELAGRMVRFFQYHIGLGKASGHVPPGIVLGLTDPVAPFIEGRSLPFQGLLGVHHEGENLVFHLDRLDGVPGLVRGLGGHRSHFLPLMAAMGVEELGLDRRRRGGVRPVNSASGRLPGDHCPDAGHFLRFPGIDALDQGMGMGAAKNGPVEQTRQGSIRRVDRCAACPLISIDPDHGFPDDRRFLPGPQGLAWLFTVLCGTHRPPPVFLLSSAARRTARKIFG